MVQETSNQQLVKPTAPPVRIIFSFQCSCRTTRRIRLYQFFRCLRTCIDEVFRFSLLDMAQLPFIDHALLRDSSPDIMQSNTHLSLTVPAESTDQAPSNYHSFGILLVEGSSFTHNTFLDTTTSSRDADLLFKAQHPRFQQTVTELFHNVAKTSVFRCGR